MFSKCDFFAETLKSSKSLSESEVWRVHCGLYTIGVNNFCGVREWRSGRLRAPVRLSTPTGLTEESKIAHSDALKSRHKKQSKIAHSDSLKSIHEKQSKIARSDALKSIHKKQSKIVRSDALKSIHIE